MIAHKTYCPECGSETTTNGLGWTSCVNEKCDFEYRVSVPPGLVVGDAKLACDIADQCVKDHAKSVQQDSLDTLLAMLKPLVWEDVFASDGELRVHSHSVAVCTFGEFHVYSKAIYLVVPGSSRVVQIGVCSGIADGKTKVDDQEFPSRVRALFEG